MPDEKGVELEEIIFTFRLFPGIYFFPGWCMQTLVLSDVCLKLMGESKDSPNPEHLSTPLTVDKKGCRSFRFLADFYKAPQLREIKIL